MEPQCNYCNLIDKHRCRNLKKAQACEHYKKQKANEDNNDFGFVFEDDTYNYEIVDNETIEFLNSKIQKLYNAIDVFLDNLSRNPEKPIINWPNRIEKIKEFKQKLKEIIEEER